MKTLPINPDQLGLTYKKHTPLIHLNRASLFYMVSENKANTSTCGLVSHKSTLSSIPTWPAGGLCPSSSDPLQESWELEDPAGLCHS